MELKFVRFDASSKLFLFWEESIRLFSFHTAEKKNHWLVKVFVNYVSEESHIFFVLLFSFTLFFFLMSIFKKRTKCFFKLSGLISKKSFRSSKDHILEMAQSFLWTNFFNCFCSFFFFFQKTLKHLSKED